MIARAPSRRVGATWLFAGCRHRDEDFLYGSELHVFQREAVLTRLEVAFSREGPEKVYVQHLIKQHVRLPSALTSTYIVVKPGATSSV